MLRKVDKVFIAKDIDRTVASGDITAAQGVALEGEVFFLDQNYQVILTADATTYADSNVIYVAEGSAEVFSTTNPDGSVLTGRRLLISKPINGAFVKNYTVTPYEAKAEAVATLPAIADTIVPGTEYVLRIVYKGDIAAQHPGQNTETYRYIAKTGDTSSEVYDGLVKHVNKFKPNTIKRGRYRVVQAANAAGSLTITGLPVNSCTTSVDDIDELVMNDFAVFLNYVDNDYNWTEVTLSGAKTYTGSDRGAGTWEVIRDIEKHAQSYEGISNRTWFPVIKPAMRTVKGTEYITHVIEHDTKFRSSDNQYNKETSLVEVIAVPNASTGTQGADILSVITTWMDSLPL